MAYFDCTWKDSFIKKKHQHKKQTPLDLLFAVCNEKVVVSKFATALKMNINSSHYAKKTFWAVSVKNAHSSRWKQGKKEEKFAHTYSMAAIWSFTSTDPKHRWTSCRILRPWNPLPLPSNRATMTLSELTSTESQSMWNLSVTNWLPGASSLQIPTHQTQTKTIDNVMHFAVLRYFI